MNIERTHDIVAAVLAKVRPQQPEGDATDGKVQSDGRGGASRDGA